MEAEGFETALIWGQTAGTYERHADALYLANYYSNQSGHDYDTERWVGRRGWVRHVSPRR
jgi:hypothetical protein